MTPSSERVPTVEADTDQGQDAVTGFGIAEISYLMSLGEGKSADKTREVMPVGVEASSPGLIAAGASSLLARGLVRIEDDRVLPTALANGVSYTLASAQRWTQFGIFRGDSLDFALYLQAPEMSALFQPRALSSWFVMVRNPARTDAELLLESIKTTISQSPDSVVFLRSHTLDDEANLFVRAGENGVWDVATVREPGDQDRDTAASTAQLLSMLEHLTQLSDPAETAPPGVPHA
ncbi:hypothetical protein BJ994_002557 [Arthrobacter pigmenti]|uniref:Uncharacterized protein n=1 Tax=Arthrobacter pigmenti TaxID=271432 RepID=A0A846RZ58_9MICC|nr:hypothetical protein [Arthrobacter pigmenti]NJC23481.1 hypothetical protein [Arthrobacter pigmenti]